ncbi:MAG: hypothetical protein EA360_00845 [Balneolaceae bacterium]|nr:MAG: hypothetical protein EA360_00845 [Balneolaceae bacterium]
MSETSKTVSNPAHQNRAFRQIVGWSVFMLVVFILFGLLHRVVSPVERHLSEDEYISRVFVEFEAVAYSGTGDEDQPAGLFDGGSVLYVVAEDSLRFQVRPFAISRLDSVWVNRGDVLDYTPEAYRQWQYEEEIRKFGFDRD